jgi:hypothetical protein
MLVLFLELHKLILVRRLYRAFRAALNRLKWSGFLVSLVKPSKNGKEPIEKEVKKHLKKGTEEALKAGLCRHGNLLR